MVCLRHVSRLSKHIAFLCCEARQPTCRCAPTTATRPGALHGGGHDAWSADTALSRSRPRLAMLQPLLLQLYVLLHRMLVSSLIGRGLVRSRSISTGRRAQRHMRCEWQGHVRWWGGDVQAARVLVLLPVQGCKVVQGALRRGLHGAQGVQGSRGANAGGRLVLQ